MSSTNQAPEAGKPLHEKPHIPDHDLIRVIGCGSYGEVWLARSTVGTFRAVKVVYRDQFGDERPFEREYAGLKLFEPLSRNHDGLVDVLHLGRNEQNGYFYYLMEAADDALTGQQIEPAQYQPRTLELEIRKRGRLPVSECLEIGSALADALAFLHQAKLVHRDVKPSNIIFVNGVPKLADIGLVAAVGDARSFVGTEGFVPPEGPGTPQADVYSLGKVLYEMSMGKDRQAFPSPPTLLDEFPDRDELLKLNEVVTKACEPDWRRRHRAAAELRAELELVRQGGSLRRRRWIRSLIGAAKLLIPAAALLAAVWGGFRAWTALSEARKPKELRLVRELTHPSVTSWAEALLGDFNGGGASDIFVAGKDQIFVMDMQGQGLMESPPRFFNEKLDKLSISLVADVEGDPKDEVFVNWRENLTNLWLGVYNQNFHETRRFRTSGAIFTDAGSIITNLGSISTNPPTKTGGSDIEAVGVFASAGNGHKRVLARVSTGYPKSPRGLYCFDYETQQLLWSNATAPCVQKVVLADLNHDGSVGIVFGTGAPGNGNRLEDGTDDEHSYLYAVSGEGALLWRRTMGGVFTYCEPLVADVKGHDEREILVRVSCGHEQTNEFGQLINHEMGKIIKYDFAGHELARYDVGVELLSLTTADLDGNGKQQVLATDRFGYLHVLDTELHLTHKIEVVSPRFHGPHDRVELRLEAVADLMGDGRKELIFCSSQVEFGSGLDAGRPAADKPVRFRHDNCVLVLNSKLQPLARYTVAETWNADPGFKVLVAKLAKGRWGLLAIGKKPVLLELASAAAK